jgi:hypothetical protein
MPEPDTTPAVPTPAVGPLASPPATPDSLDDLPSWVDSYLTGTLGERGPQAHQYTVNDLTYAFLAENGVASLPDFRDAEHRRYSLLGGLLTSRPGDLLFVYQYDHDSFNPPDLGNRRGLRGIFVIGGEPFADPADLTASNGYTMLGTCPTADCPANASGVGRILPEGRGAARINEPICRGCGEPFPSCTVDDGSRPEFTHAALMLPSRVLLSPLATLPHSVADNLAYGDMSHPGILWTGRHDNAMGRGKGSSTRHLVREEAVKLTRLLVAAAGGAEPATEFPAPYSPESPLPLSYEPGVPIGFPRARPRARRVLAENELLVDHAINFDNPDWALAAALPIPAWVAAEDLVYVGCEPPCGYTGNEMDFLACYRDGDNALRAIVIENKRERAGNMEMAQLALYSEWAAQFLLLNSAASVRLRILPVLIASSFEPDLVAPAPYSLAGVSYLGSGVSHDVQVECPIAVSYSARLPLHRVAGPSGETCDYATGIEYERHSVPAVEWLPQRGSGTTQRDKEDAARALAEAPEKEDAPALEPIHAGG